MPIGEFGRAPGPVAEGAPVLTTPLYWMYEMGHAALNPSRAMADATRLLFQNPMNPFAQTEFGKSVAAACELFERTTRRYGKPEWGINDVDVNGMRVPVNIHTVWEKPFCRLLHFERQLAKPLRTPHPRVLIVAPMSGHYATLLRGTVEAFLPNHEVYITDWADARFLQLNGFVSMNLDRHIDAHKNLFRHLVQGDGDSVQKHREFYDEYLAVMDLSAEYYLQTVDTVFVKHQLPKGQMTHRGNPVDLKAIERVALMTVEGEKDDISGLGQTRAAHELCSSLAADKKVHYEQKGVGHYGVFNGSRFRAEIMPRVADFMRSAATGPKLQVVAR